MSSPVDPNLMSERVPDKVDARDKVLQQNNGN
jgi:hypothetical protein